MNKLVALAVLLASIDAGEVNLETPEITKEDVQAYRRTKFTQIVDQNIAGIFEKKLPVTSCDGMYSDSEELGFFRCTFRENLADGGVMQATFGTLYFWSPEIGGFMKVPTTFTEIK
jgi:hypothetical protein